MNACMGAWVSTIIGTGENISIHNCNWIPYEEGFTKPLSNVTDKKIKVKNL